MNIALITGSAGLIGAASVRRFAQEGLTVVGIDNDMRAYFFGKDASTEWSRNKLQHELPSYLHHALDIRDEKQLETIFKEYSKDIKVVVHTAAQPSHDWAAKEPKTDFTINANGTLNLLECTRQFCPEATFIFTSTNKVYGDTPNRLPLVEQATRWELDPSHSYYEYGIDEQMSIDNSKHSLFGASKVAADILVQEYGRYFGMKTAVFRGGCLTGPGHSGAALHGFLAYLMKCAITQTHYYIQGYKGKQVRDNIHCDDLVDSFWQVYQAPRVAEVYNIGGGRHANCSMQEAINLCESIVGKSMQYSYKETNRIGDHIWWVSDIRKFQTHYPQWKLRYSIEDILREIHEELTTRHLDHKQAANI